MTSLPYGGATFAPVRITEQGRAHLSAKLRALAEPELEDLFAQAGFGGDAAGAVPPSEWARALLAKVRELADRSPCPSSVAAAP